jgi:hypothetical protein
MQLDGSYQMVPIPVELKELVPSPAVWNVLVINNSENIAMKREDMLVMRG